MKDIGLSMISSEPAVQKLVTFQRQEILQHLLRLPPQDRRLRFGTYMNDAAVAAYVEKIDFARDK
ncbi:MAG TPA: GNAT family N-acetyltransferase, partial [Burkholderiales bacterium]|nr:GNAT family N-acetyltransferase [Burkholderiales bacterium]